MKEAFDTMGSHPLLTLFLGFVVIIAIHAITEMLADIFKRKP